MAEDPAAGRRSDPPEPGSEAGTGPDQRHLHGTRWGDLVLLEEIGRGSFGTVYQAHDPRLDRAVAVKLLRPTPGDDSLEIHSAS